MSDTGFVSHCLELLSPLGSTSSRRMFGGHALYIDGLCVALIISDTLYLKVDDTHRALFERAGCKPFTYAGKHDEVHVMSYYTAPEEAMESPAAPALAPRPRSSTSPSRPSAARSRAWRTSSARRCSPAARAGSS